MFSELLTLDHFLLSFHSRRFAQLLPLCKVLKNCEQKVVTRPDVSYKGIYLIAHNGNYLELLKYDDKSPNIFGIAFSSLFPEKGDIDDFLQHYPNLTWSSKKIFDNQHNPWYSHFGLNPIEEAIKGKVVFWAMKYHNFARHRAYQYMRTPPPVKDYSVEEFLAASIIVPGDTRAIVEQQAQWVPGKHRIDENSASFIFLNASRNKFDLRLEFNDAITDCRLESISLKLLKGIKVGSLDFSPIQLIQKKTSLTMTFTTDL